MVIARIEISVQVCKILVRNGGDNNPGGCGHIHRNFLNGGEFPAWNAEYDSEALLRDQFHVLSLSTDYKKPTGIGSNTVESGIGLKSASNNVFKTNAALFL